MWHMNTFVGNGVSTFFTIVCDQGKKFCPISARTFPQSAIFDVNIMQSSLKFTKSRKLIPK